MNCESDFVSVISSCTTFFSKRNEPRSPVRVTCNNAQQTNRPKLQPELNEGRMTRFLTVLLWTTICWLAGSENNDFEPLFVKIQEVFSNKTFRIYKPYAQPSTRGKSSAIKGEIMPFLIHLAIEFLLKRSRSTLVWVTSPFSTYLSKHRKI